MSPPPDRAAAGVQLEESALQGIAGGLADLYFELYDEFVTDPRASLTGNMLAFVFAGGLSAADEKLLLGGREDRLREFRSRFFEVTSDEFGSEVTRLTEMPVRTCFDGFDSAGRTTYLIFVLDLSDSTEERRAVLGWSDQVRRNAQRLREQHRATQDEHHQLVEEWRVRREEMGRIRKGGGRPGG